MARLREIFEGNPGSNLRSAECGHRPARLDVLGLTHRAASAEFNTNLFPRRVALDRAARSIPAYERPTTSGNRAVNAVTGNVFLRHSDLPRKRPQGSYVGRSSNTEACPGVRKGGMLNAQRKDIGGCWRARVACWERRGQNLTYLEACRHTDYHWREA